MIDAISLKNAENQGSDSVETEVRPDFPFNERIFDLIFAVNY